jgi:hypothetical protein
MHQFSCWRLSFPFDPGAGFTVVSIKAFTMKEILTAILKAGPAGLGGGMGGCVEEPDIFAR